VITLEAASAVPPFEQIRSQLAAQVRSGVLVGGQRLPSVRQLAGDLQVAAGTVARAYAELEAAGLLETSRTLGTRVRVDQVVDPELLRAADRFVRLARRHSVDLTDALGTIRTAWTLPD
jgi:GntR family transcriptional regulator